MWYTVDDMEKSLRIYIAPETIFLILFLLLAGWFLYAIQSLLLIVVSAVIFSLALAPGKRFLSRFRIPDPISVLLLYTMVFALLFFFVYSLVPIFVQQYQVFWEMLPSAISTIQGAFAGTVLENVLSLDGFVTTFVSSEQVAETLQVFIEKTGLSLTVLFGGLVNIVLFFLLTFLFSVKPESLDDFLYTITPTRYRAYVEDLWSRAKVKVGQWFQGQIVLIFLISALSYFALSILDVPNALFLAVFAGVMEIIPIFGPIIGGIPAVLMALTTGDVTTVLLVIAVFIIIQQLENTLIYPLVVSKVVGISAILIVLAIVIGGSIAGFIGILIAVPLAGVIQEFFADLKSGRIRELRESDP